VQLPRSTFYYRSKANSKDASLLRAAIEQICQEQPRYGYRRVVVELKQKAHKVGKEKVRQLMGEMNLLVATRRKPHRTTDGVKRDAKFENLLKGLSVVRPNQVWCCDITYVPLVSGASLYLALVIDVFTRIIRGWRLSKAMTVELTLAALDGALGSGLKPEIHHSDHGSQYRSVDYCRRLLDLDCRISRSAAAWENPYIESFIGKVKDEIVWLEEYHDFSQAPQSLGDFIEFYNRQRIHSALNYLSPFEFERRYLIERNEDSLSEENIR
jgi:putative transposase